MDSSWHMVHPLTSPPPLSHLILPSPPPQEPVEKVLRDSKMSKNQVHDVVLVGGSTRIPRSCSSSPTSSASAPRVSLSRVPLPLVACSRSRAHRPVSRARALAGKEPSKSINPDEAVAYGAAV